MDILQPHWVLILLGSRAKRLTINRTRTHRNAIGVSAEEKPHYSDIMITRCYCRKGSGQL
jgi:hypothetical protein